MKQRINIPKLFQSENIDTSNYSEELKQILGFFAQPPSSYEEYFEPASERTFRQPVV